MRRSTVAFWCLALVALSTTSVPAIASPTAPFDVAIEHEGNIVPPQSPAEAPDRYDVTVTGAETVEITSPDLNRSLLTSMFDGTTTQDGVRVGVPENDTITMALTAVFDCRPGTYDLRFRSESGGTATARLALPTPTDVTEIRGSNVVRTGSGETATIPIRVDACRNGPVSLSVAASESDRWWNATIRRSGDGEPGTVLFATNATTSRFVAARGNVTIRSQSASATAGSPLPTGEYDVRLAADGDTVAVGTLSIRPPEDIATQSPTSMRRNAPTRTATPPTRSPTQTTASTTRVTAVTTEQTDSSATPAPEVTEPPSSTMASTPSRPGTPRSPTTGTGDGPWLFALALALGVVISWRCDR